MQAIRIIELIPLWGVFLIMVGSILAAVQAGSWIGAREKMRLEAGAKASAGETVGASLGLVALIMAFTFNLAASRHDIRRTLVLNEANAVETTFLRAGLLPEPHAARIRRALH